MQPVYLHLPLGCTLCVLYLSIYYSVCLCAVLAPLRRENNNTLLHGGTSKGLQVHFDSRKAYFRLSSSTKEWGPGGPPAYMLHM